MRQVRLIFLGPPGSGKGTQAQRLVVRLGLVQLSSGDVLRREIQAATEIGKQAAGYYNVGALVPDDIVSGVMVAAVGALPPGTGFVLDGFPRTVPQAEVLERGLTALQVTIDAVLDFRLDDALIIRRIGGRRICTRCNALYNAEFSPPRQAGVCDRCGGPLTQRADDVESVVAARLDAYRRQTAPLVEYYQRRGLLHPVDAGGPVDGVAAQVAAIIASLGPAA